MKKGVVVLGILLLLLNIYPLIEVVFTVGRPTIVEGSRNFSLAGSRGELFDERDFSKERGEESLRDDFWVEIPDLSRRKDSVEDPTDILVLVNKERSLSSDFVPDDLVIPDIPFIFEEDLPKKYLRQEAALAVEDLFSQAVREGIKLAGVSGYRSYDRQRVIFARNVRQRGEAAARKFSAAPGKSEHQTGLALDVSSPDVNYSLTQRFGQTEAGRWLSENAAEYGFIIRYPKGREEITGYQYEPWHIRYVGKKHALYIDRNDLTLEEYLRRE